MKLKLKINHIDEHGRIWAYCEDFIRLVKIGQNWEANSLWPHNFEEWLQGAEPDQ